MARSVWKGPFVDGYLLKKAERLARVGPQRGDQDLEPALDHPAAVRRAHLRRLQRPEAHPGARSPRRWSATSSASSRRPARSITATRADRKAKRRDRARRQRWARRRASARSPTTRRRRSPRMLRVSPQKLNLVAAADPRQEGRGGARRPRLLAQAHRRRRQEDAGIGDRQRREQPRPRRRRSGRGRGACRQGDGHEALHRRARRGRVGRIIKPFSHLTIVVRQVEARQPREAA